MPTDPHPHSQKTGPAPYDGVNLYLNTNKPTASTLAGAEVTGQVFVASSPPPATFVDGSVHVLGIKRAGSTLELRVDGTLSGSTTSASVANVDVSAVGSDALIGQNGFGTPPPNEFQQFHGDIAEEIGINGVLTQTEVSQLEQYLKARYGL